MKLILLFILVIPSITLAQPHDLLDNSETASDEWKALEDGRFDDAIKINFDQYKKAKGEELKLRRAKRIFNLRVALKLCEYAAVAPQGCGDAAAQFEDFEKSHLCAYSRTSLVKKDCEKAQANYLTARNKLGISKKTGAELAKQFISESDKFISIDSAAKAGSAATK